MAARKKAARKRRPGKGELVEEMRRLQIRVPAGLAEFIDDTAAEFGLSRDAFLRLQLSAVRDALKAARSRPESEEAELFKRVENRIVEATERVVSEAVRNAMLISGEPVRKGVKR